METNSSVYRRAARENWPEEYKEHGGVAGDGPFASVCCAFEHPSARVTCLGSLCLAETAEEAQAMAASWCEAKTKGLCRGKHPVYRYDQQADKWEILGAWRNRS